jgi:GDPmannose 4,6-dehydratase
MYGDNPEHPQSEGTRLMPASPYACAKVFAHGLTRNYREGYSIHASSGILFNHESPRRGETFVTRKITLAAARIKLGFQDKIHLGNLDAKRDWGYAKDYVEAMWLMLQQEKPDDYVIATGETHTVREFLSEVFAHAELDIEKHLVIDERLKRPHEVPLLLGDPDKAKRTLGWEPKTTFKGLAKLMYEADLEMIKKLNTRSS